MTNAVELASREKCTGCGACKAICPKGAITFQADSEGFPSPVIDNDICIHCRQCENACPALNKPETHSIISAYAAQLKDQQALFNSTSGGVFIALAREVFRRGGVVFGCVWDDDYNAVIRKAENEDELRPMQGSKYVWSWAGDAFPEVKAQLNAGRTVLYTGMPCQIAGLRKYLNKDYDNLYTVGFLCGGAPSPLAFHEYLKTITNDVPLNRLDFKLRDKDRYGVGVHITYNSAKGKVYQTYIQNPYFFAYHTKVFHRRPCYQCQYRYEQRVEDITFGDYWGLDNYHNEFDTVKGVSGVLVNTPKGTELFDTVRDQMKVIPTKLKDLAAANNLTLGDARKTFHIPAYRDAFIACMKDRGYKSAERKYLYNKTRLKLWLKQFMPKKYKKLLKKLLGRG